MAEGSDDKINTFREAGSTAFVLGYTGETGKRLIKELAKEKLFKKVVLIGRREVELSSDFGPEFVSFYAPTIKWWKGIYIELTLSVCVCFCLFVCLFVCVFQNRVRPKSSSCMVGFKNYWHK